MKVILTFILCQFIVLCSYGQPRGSNDYTNSINDYTISIYNLIHNRFKDTVNLRRLETGTLTLDNGELSASTSRRMFSGNKYLVFVCTDDRVPGFTLSAYHHVDNKWNLIETVNKDKKEPDAALIGNYEIYDLNTTEDGLYKFSITTPNHNKTARYAFMIFSQKLKSQSTASTTVNNDPVPNFLYSVDYYNVCFWNSSTLKYNEWGENKTFSCSFELNTEKTVFKEIVSPTEVYRYYVQSKRSDGTWDIYEVLDADGKKMSFLLPIDPAKGVFRVHGQAKDNTPYLIDYHLKK